MERRFLFRFASALTIVGVTAGLLVPLSHHHSPPASPAAILSATPTAAATSRDSAGVDMASPPVATSLSVSHGKPSPRWKIAFVVNPYSDTYVLEKQEIWTANVDGTDKRRILENPDTPSWSPDRTRLAFAREGNVWISTPDGSRQWRVTFWPPKQVNNEGEPLRIQGISWDMPDHQLSFARREKFEITLPGGTTKDVWGRTIFHASLLPGRIGDRYPFVQSPKASAAMWQDDAQGDYSDPQNLASLDITDDRTPFRFGDNAFPAWAPSGKRFAFARNGDLWLANRENPTPDDSHTTWYDTRLIACAAYDGGQGYGDHSNVGVTNVAWSPDGNSLLYTLERVDGGGFAETHLVRLGAADADYPDRYPNRHDESVGDGGTCTFSPDGKWILTVKSQKWVAESLDAKKSYPISIDGDDLVW